MDTMYDVLYEQCMNGDIDYDTFEYLTESVIPTAKILKIKKTISAIKEGKPTEYSDDADVIKFIDKNYDDIMKIAKILEEEPSKIRKRMIITSIIPVIGAVASFMTPLTASVPILILDVLALLVFPAIMMLIESIRESGDIKICDELEKIKRSLYKMNTRKLPTDIRHKLTDIQDAISDANAEVLDRGTITKECVENSIYEAYDCGNINRYEASALLDHLYNSI